MCAMDEELPPDDPWNGKAWRLEKEQGVPRERTLERLLIEHLDALDTRPLVDLIRKGGDPGPRVSRYFAATFDHEKREELRRGGTEIPIEIRIEAVDLPKGRPRKSPPAGAAFNRQLEAYRWFRAGVEEMWQGRNPSPQAWQCFLWLLAPEDMLAANPNMPPFPFRAKCFRTDGKKGRPCNPEVGERDLLLARLVACHVERLGPGSYDSAITQIANDYPFIGRQTIRDAYDRLAKRKAGKCGPEK
jgi:hypothetical protein